MTILNILCFMLLLVTVIGTKSDEEYDSDDINDYNSSAIGSDSNEFYNISVHNKPVRIKFGIFIVEDNATTDTIPAQNKLRNDNRTGETKERSGKIRIKMTAAETQLRHGEKIEEETELKTTQKIAEGYQLLLTENTEDVSSFNQTEKTSEGCTLNSIENTVEGNQLRFVEKTEERMKLGHRENVKEGNNFRFTENIKKGDGEGNSTNISESRRTRTAEEIEYKLSLSNYPYSVSVQRKNAHYASGALIDERWILTVAAEFYNIRESIRLFRARMGSVNSKKGGALSRITLIEIHPSFKPYNSRFDLSLLRLAMPVTFSDYIRPVVFSKLDTNVFQANFITTYWPRLVIRDTVLPNTAKERQKSTSMRVSTQQLIPWNTCSRMLQRMHEVLDEESMCLKALISHHSVCMPDVGAPVVADDGLLGITSGWVPENCTGSPTPTIITKTSSADVRSWLDKFSEIS